jgi:hypothetical protein
MKNRRRLVMWSSVALICIALPACLPSATARGTADGVFARVPEADDYELVYDLDVPVSASFNADGVQYTVDRSAELEEPFDRIAYYLELRSADGTESWAYASMRAFTGDLSLIGIPSRDTGAFWQRLVDDMNVYSNVPGVTTGTELGGGNLEFWHTNYGAANTAAVPGASSAVCDWGDAPAGTADYGSMQVHNHSAGETILAYNRWGASGGSAGDIGIGNNAVAAGDGPAHTDWTFRANAGQYASRRLQVLVRPGSTPLELQVVSPGRHEVFQRDRTSHADVPVRGTVTGRIKSVEARARVIGGFSGTPTDWRIMDDAPTAEGFTGTLRLRAGWYAVDVRVRRVDGSAYGAAVQPVGVGEVLITAGQSNAANSGKPPLAPTDPRVSAYGPGGWQPAADPQPIATGGGGTPWPVLGDLLAERLDIPIGFISVGWGGTRVDQWLPGLNLYPRLRDALAVVEPNGARAVLWHQGEADASTGTPAPTYAERLSLVIAGSRRDAGYDLPWGVALVSFLPGGDAERMAAVVAGQRSVIDSDPLVFEGPNTDDLVGEEWRHDGIHFNEAGLREHARRWSEVIPFPSLLPTDALLPWAMR